MPYFPSRKSRRLQRAEPAKGDDDLWEPYEMPVDAASNPASGCDMNWCLTSVAQSTIEPPQFVSASPSLPHNLGTLPSPCRPANKKAGLAANNKLDRPVHVPRPPNPFIVYRMEFVNKEENRKKFNYSQPALSRACGEAWRKLTLEERKPYQELSVNEGIKHAIENPGYRYSPGCFSHSPRTSKSRGCLRRRTAMLSNTKYNSDITDCSPRALTARRRRRYSSATSQSTISTRRIEAEPTHVPDQAKRKLWDLNIRPSPYDRVDSIFGFKTQPRPAVLNSFLPSISAHPSPTSPTTSDLHSDWDFFPISREPEDAFELNFDNLAYTSLFYDPFSGKVSPPSWPIRSEAQFIV